MFTTMQLFTKLIFMALAGGYLIFGTYIYLQNRKEYLNRLFFICSVVIAYRALCEGEMRTAGQLCEAVFWANASFMRVFSMALLLHFILYYTGFWHKLDRVVAWGIVYLPAVLFSYVFLMVYDKSTMLTHSRYGWMFGNSFSTLSSQLHLAWALLIGVSSTALLWIYYRKTTGHERNQIRAITMIFSHTLLFAIAVSFLKKFNIIDLYFFNGIVTLVVGLLMGYLVWRFRVLLSPALVMEEILGSMEEGLLIVGSDGKLKKMNQTVLRITGYGERELSERPATIILPGNVLKSLPGDVVKKTEQVFTQFESIITTKTGKTIPIRYAMSTMRHGKVRAAVQIIIFRDLTPFKEVEWELQKVQKYEAFELLTQSIAHDFNNLLCAISIHLSLCDFDETLSSEVRANLRNTNQAALLAGNLITQLSAFFKNVPIIKTECSIAKIITDVAGIVQCDKKIMIIFGDIDSLPPVFGVPQQLMQVFLNLFINARQASDATVKVTISGHLSLRGDDVVIQVQDNGCGMPQEVMDRIFQPHFSTRGNGRGLGLTIVTTIINSHDGTIKVSSTEGSGTTFTITLPVSGKSNTTQSKENTDVNYVGSP